MDERQQIHFTFAVDVSVTVIDAIANYAMKLFFTSFKKGNRKCTRRHGCQPAVNVSKVRGDGVGFSGSRVTPCRGWYRVSQATIHE